MGVVHGGGWFIRSSHVALIYSPKPRIYFIHWRHILAIACEPRHLKTEKKRLLNRNYRKPGPSDLYIGRDAFRSMRALFGAVFGVP